MTRTYLFHALCDLDATTAMTPLPVLKAITAELHAEARGLRANPDDDTQPARSTDRLLNAGLPLLTISEADGPMTDDRKALDHREDGLTREQLTKATADLRLLIDVHSTCRHLDIIYDDFSISDDPFGDYPISYYLSVEAPMPDGWLGRRRWAVELALWVPDRDDDSQATGRPVLTCARPTPASTAEITDLLRRSAGRVEQLVDWAKTPLGDALAGTAFVVTKRYDDGPGSE